MLLILRKPSRSFEQCFWRAVSQLYTVAVMKWLIKNKETGLYLKNVWNWTNKVSDAFVFPNGLSLVEFCIRHQVPPMDMIPLTDGGAEAKS
jgi:hypothetical protein